MRRRQREKEGGSVETQETKSSAFSLGLLWFGAGVSIAEILTGMLVAPLGFAKGFAAILLGHIIGGMVMYGAGLIGARRRESAMETVRISFGRGGGRFFSVLNVIQLIGWTAVMIVSAAHAANLIRPWGMTTWSVIVGLLIIIWIALGIKKLNKVNVAVITLLFLLTVVLSVTVGRGHGGFPVGPSITFGGAVEMAVAMPLSWLPVIADYTRRAEHPVRGTLVACTAYFIAGMWMFLIGMGAVIFTGENDIAAVMVKAGLGLCGILIVLLSTVTTTFLDAFSAGVSARSLWDTAPENATKGMAIIATVLGVVIAVTASQQTYQDFLYFIGSVFAPMTAILLADYFILHRDRSRERLNLLNLVLWGIGFIVYRCLMTVDTPLGITFPVIVLIMIGSTIVHGIEKKIRS